jgi:biotin operon repressor
MNMGFRFRNSVKECKCIQDLTNDGYQIRHLGGGCYSVTNLSDAWVTRIMKDSAKYWFF